MRYYFPEPPDTSFDKKGRSRSGRICNCCGERIGNHKQKIFNVWICDLVQIEGGNWIAARRVKKGDKIIQRMIEDV